MHHGRGFFLRNRVQQSSDPLISFFLVDRPLSKNRENTLFLFAFVVLLFVCLGGLSYWFISFASVSSAGPGREESGLPRNEPDRAAQGDAARMSASDRINPVSFEIAQYDRKPEGYVGTEVCASCHQDRHQSYLLTHHSRSLREVGQDFEGLGKSLSHPLSKRSYDVVEKDGALWHREWRHFSGAPNDRMPVAELPVCYVMGSGAFGKGYLMCDGDYLLQSPVTWYSGTDDLGIAPGYDRPNHFGMKRVIASECIFCHAGLATERDDNPNHLAIHELSIGCERCHGPGEAHTKLYQEIQAGVSDPSFESVGSRIVHPGKLSRAQTESICGQCHLHGDVVIHPEGRKLWDYVAGDDFSETRLHYKHDKRGDFKDSFTGHFDQMWQSKCYLQSETLTCITCHDPHRAEPIDDLVTLRRQQCNVCHEGEDACGLPLDERMERADNSCVKCHMPSIESDVPHTSTTSHLIAIYDSLKPRGIEASDKESLRRVQTSPTISRELLDRADVVAKAVWAVDQAREGDFESLDDRTLDEELEKKLLGDRFDAYTHSLLARMNRLRADRIAYDEDAEDAETASNVDQTWAEVASHAPKALRLEKRPNTVRTGALEALGNQQMFRGKYVEAAQSFTELTQIRRSATDWYNLGLCMGKQQRFTEAERAFREAIRLDGAYVAPYRSLSILYRSIDPSLSQRFNAVAQRLMRQ